MWHVRQRLIEASAKTTFDDSVSESVTAATKAAQRKRRTYAKRKQARKVGAATVNELTSVTTEGSEASLASVVGADPPLIKEAISDQVDEEVGRIISDGQTQSESEDEQLDAEAGLTDDSSEGEQALASKAVQAYGEAPAPREDANREPMSQHISMTDVNDNVCSCADEPAWGCIRHMVYPSSLLLAHRELSLKMANGPPGLEPPPGLELPPEATRALRANLANRIIFTKRL